MSTLQQSKDDPPAQRYQFRINGSWVSAPVRAEWYVAAMDAVAAGYAHWVGDGELCVYSGVGAEIARI